MCTEQLDLLENTICCSLVGVTSNIICIYVSSFVVNEDFYVKLVLFGIEFKVKTLQVNIKPEKFVNNNGLRGWLIKFIYLL